jgi:heat shock transcription factor
MQVMGQRLQVTEQRQQQMMTFLAKAMQNPAFLV